MLIALFGLSILLAGICGASSQEKDQANQSAAFTQNLRQHYADLYKNQTDTLDKLNNTISAPATLGFTPQERATYNTQALENTAANYANAKRGIANIAAGQGGGGASASGIESGVQRQLQTLASTEAARTLSEQQQNISLQDAAVGREEKQRNIAGYEALAGLQSPNQAANTSISSGEQAFGQAKSNREAGQQFAKDIAGLATSIGTSFIPGAGAFKSGALALSGQSAASPEGFTYGQQPSGGLGAEQLGF